MLRVLLFLILIISLSSSSLYADTNPFRFLNDSPRNKRYINFMCNKADLKKFRGADLPQLVVPLFKLEFPPSRAV